VHGSFGSVTWTNNGQVLGHAASPLPLSNLALHFPQTEYRGILNSVGFQEAPTGELLEREQKVLSRKKEAEIIYDRLRDPNEVAKGSEQPGSATGSTGEADYSVMANDHASTDAEGEPDTTTSALAVATEKTNGENTQKKENHGEDKVKASPALEVSDITFSLVHATWAQGLAGSKKENDELQVSNRARCSAGIVITVVLGGRARRRCQETARSLRLVRQTRPQLRRQGRTCLPPLQGASRRMLACRQTTQGRNSRHARVRPPSTGHARPSFP